MPGCGNSHSVAEFAPLAEGFEQGGQLQSSLAAAGLDGGQEKHLQRIQAMFEMVPHGRFVGSAPVALLVAGEGLGAEGLD